MSGRTDLDELPGVDGDAYDRLTPAARLVAQLYGVASPTPIAPTLAYRILARTNVRIGKRRVFAKDVERCNAELMEAGLATHLSVDTAVVAALDWVIPLTRAAHREGNLQRLLDAIKSEINYYRYGERFDHKLIRACLVAGDTSRVEQLAKGTMLPIGYWRFLAEPWSDELFAALPVSFRRSALNQCLRHAIETAAPAEPVINAALTTPETKAHFTPAVAFVRVLQGRFEDAEGVFADLSSEAQAEKNIAIAWTATRALICLLQGNDDGALHYIDQALELERAGTRKRLIFPNSRAFALALLALARVDSGASQSLLDQLQRGAERAGVRWRSELDLVLAAKYVKLGHSLQFGGVQRSPDIDAFFQSIACCWLDEFPENWRGWSAGFVRYRERALANGYAWVAAECEEILRRAPRGVAVNDTAGAPTPNHASLGTTTLTTLAAPLPDWEFSLKALEQLAFETGNKSKRKKTKSNTPVKRRLAWDLQDDGYEITAEPREQRQQKNGTWTKGRRMSLQRFANDAAKLDYLLPQDREAATVLYKERSWGGKQQLWAGARAIHALAGHPHIFNESGASVDIVRREPELSVGESKDGKLLVTMAPRADVDEYYDDHPRYLTNMATDQRCEVTHFSPNHMRLLQFIPQDGLNLPTDTRPRLLEAVSSLAGEVRVQSAESETAATARRVDADAQPWVRLEPFEAGLSVALVVEPIAESGICFEPGAGGVTVFANSDGESLQASRDLGAEQAAMLHLIGQCPKLAAQPTELEPLLLPDPNECLELLETLDEVGARCKWPKGEPFRIVARASTPSLNLSIKSADEWLRASGKLPVDDRRVLDLKQLFALLDANPGSRFVQLEAGQFLALTRTFRRQLDDLSSLAAPGGKGSLRMHRMAAMALDDLFADADVTADSGYDEHRARIDAAKTVAPDVPSTLRAELRPYQIEGFRWLARLAEWGAGACLADDMGLGKTIQALALLLRRAPDGPALVVAPTSVVANWQEEARRFAPTLNVKPYTGVAETRAELLDAPEAFDLYLTTYGLLQNDIERLAQVRWRSVVLDEAQAIKNPATKRARAARQLVADFRLVTTGTPIQNHLMDLHSLFSFLNPGLLGSAQHFQRSFGNAAERGDRDATARLRRLVAPFLLRRLKTEVLDDLPERTEITLHVRMSPEEGALYEALRVRAVEELEAAGEDGAHVGEGARRVQVLAHLTRLRLACCHPRLVLDDPKVPRAVGPGEKGRQVTGPQSSKLQTFAETLSELIDNQHKVLVFSQFVKHLKLVEAFLVEAGIAYQYLDGSTPAKARRDRINAFQSGQGDVFLISLKAGGTGLNLTAADYVIHLDPWWNPAVEDQASDRAHRIGQTRPVTIYRLVTEGTIEEQIVELHHHKRDLADRLLEGADATARLGADELLELLRRPLGR